MQRVITPVLPSNRARYCMIAVAIGIIVILVMIAFPFSWAVVGSESMSPTLQKGDILIWEPVEQTELSIGDIVIFKSYTQWPEEKLVVHRVLDITYDSNGNMLFETKGDANEWIDQERPHVPEPYISHDHIIGKVICVGSQPLKIPTVVMMHSCLCSRIF